jgi:hypothetical protein
MEISWPVFWQKIKYSQGLACINAATRALAMSLRPGQRFCAVLGETGSVHLNLVAEEVSRVADLSSEDFN